MAENVNVQYVGFEAKTLVREYSFVVRQASSETREFAITIVNEAFTSHRLSYQDGPNICSLKLHRELATFSNNPPETHYRISEGELAEYRDAHSPKAARSFRPQKPQRVFS
jgi:hypothetical protein